jgi:hypothetical protein
LFLIINLRVETVIGLSDVSESDVPINISEMVVEDLVISVVVSDDRFSISSIVATKSDMVIGLFDIVDSDIVAVVADDINSDSVISLE